MSFGLVVTVAKMENETSGIRAANDSSLAFGASIWTRDTARAARVAQPLDAGSVWQNDHAYSYAPAQASWGGRKSSGLGQTHAREGRLELTTTNFVDRDSGRVPVPWWYPYDANAVDAILGPHAPARRYRR